METKQTQRQKYAPLPTTELISELSASLHTTWVSVVFFFFFGARGEVATICMCQLGGGDLSIPDTDESTFKFFAFFSRVRIWSQATEPGQKLRPSHAYFRPAEL